MGWIAPLAAGAAFAVGIGTAVPAKDVALARAPRSAPIAVWAADRDASYLYGLDADLVLTRQIHVDWPVDVETCQDGSIWVLRSSDGTPGGVKRLDHFTRTGALESEITTGLALDLAVFAGRDALIIELEEDTPASARALRFGVEGSLHFLIATPGLSCIAGSGASVAVGTADGTVLRVDAGGAPLDRADVGGRIADIAPGPEPGSLWVLDTSAERRLLLLDRELDLVWSTVIELQALHLTAVPGEERVWLASTDEPRALRFGPGGTIEIERELPLGGLDRGVAWNGAGVLLAAPGAILHLDSQGRLAPGQGGFDYLTDLAR